jgi:hypothetical protein
MADPAYRYTFDYDVSGRLLQATSSLNDPLYNYYSMSYGANGNSEQDTLTPNR